MREAPVKTGETVEIDITGISHTGAGIGRVEGFTVFVPYSIPGEKVTCLIEDIKKGYATASLVKVITAFPQRQEPLCPDFFRCGGSHLQHLTYKAQLEAKQKIVGDIIRRIGKLPDVEVMPVKGMDQPWGYRNKAVFQVVESEGTLRLGFFEEESYQVNTTGECLLLHKQIREAASLVEALLNRHKISAFDWDRREGLLRHVVIRRSWAENKLMIVLVTGNQAAAKLQVVAKELIRNPGIVSVVRNINDSPGRTVFGAVNTVLAGSAKISDKLCGLEFLISPTSFYQVNPVQTEVLYQKVREYSGLTGKETVLDVYCGIGTIGIYLAQFAGKVIGLEIYEGAVADAAANAKLNDIHNAEFIVGRAEIRLPKLAAQGVTADVVVVDPPRKGVDKRALQAIAEMGPERIVYVSCDPASMARDLDFLRHRGYKAVEVQPVDMFPQTCHVECVVLLMRG